MEWPLIHIGYPKTGTTFLQTNVFCDPKRFLALWGRYELGEAMEHFVVTHPRRFSPEWVRERYRAGLAHADNGRRPVISHENLCGNCIYGRYYGHEVAQRISETFPEARVLITVREQRSMLHSIWGQYVRQEGQWSMDRFFGTGREPTGFAPICRLDHFEYDLLVADYVERLGSDRVLVLPYEVLKQDPDAFVKRVCDFAEVEFDPAQAQWPQANKGYGAATLAVLRWMNHWACRPPLFQRDGRVSLAVRAKFKIARILNRALPASAHLGPEARLREWIAARVGDYFQPSNRRLQAYCADDLAGLGYDLGAEPPDAGSPVSGGYATHGQRFSRIPSLSNPPHRPGDHHSSE